jgi:hypothetical protein
MKRNFNYTHRKKLDRTRLPVALIRSGGPPSFVATPHLDGLGLNADALVFLEAYVQRSLMRFAYGTVGQVVPPASTELTDLEAGDQIFFRIKVVEDAGGHGLILAAADGIVALDPDAKPSQRMSLLDIVYADDMGQQLWALDFNEASGPSIRVNSAIPDARLFMRTGINRALLLPAILGEILTHLAFVHGGELTDDDLDTWSGKWLAMVRTFYRVAPPSRDESEDDWPAAAREWIAGATRAFADRIGSLGMYVSVSEHDGGGE